MNQLEKGNAFRDLHQGPLFIIPNPWDAGSARLLAGLGAKALATTSAGLAWTLGRRDGGVTRQEALYNAAQIASAVELPVSGDLENGYGDAPDHAAETIRLAADVGLVGGSIEDASGNPEAPIYDFELSVRRVEAAAWVAHALPFPFTFVARAENFLHGRRDLSDTIRRLQAYEAAGADVLFAPGLPDLDAIRTVVASVSKPLNVVLWQKQSPYTIADLAAAGVQRVSSGGSFARAALSGLRDAAMEVLGPGTLSYLDGAITTAEVHQYLPPKQ